MNAGVVGSIALLVLVACSRPKTEAPTALPDDIVVDADAAPREPPPRCVLTAIALGIPHDPAAGDLELGESTPHSGGVAVGAVRGVGSKLVASVVQIDQAVSRLSVVDLGTPRGDTPPPRPFLIGDGLYAAYYPARASAADAKAAREAALSIVVVRLRDGHSEPVMTVATAKADSLDFDVEGGAADAVLAWDEDDTKTHRGVIQVVRVAPVGAASGAPVKATTFAADGADAESPRVVRRAGGYWLVWAARSPDDLDAAGSALNGHSNRWLEAAPLDGEGRRAGATRRLTPVNGHVASFSVLRIGQGDVDIVARDEVDGADSQSARALRIRVRGDSFASPDVLVASNVGRGVPDLLPARGDGGKGWLSFVDVLGRARLLPLDSNYDANGAASSEPLLDESRPIAPLPSDANGSRLLIISPTAASQAVRIAQCAP